ncbi:MAG: hypothetical protein IKF91_03600 [Bacilli bacterium]|nr:hypothetical protein [Bacilli bacterium]
MRDKLTLIYNKDEEIENIKYKRELLNMKLTISILNKEDKKQISHIRKEIMRLTKIIGDNYLDAHDRLQEEIKETISDILSKNITNETAYSHAKEIEEYIINQKYKIKENEFEDELIILYGSYEQLGYTPKNTKKDFSTIKNDTIETNKKDYINQVLYNLLSEEKVEVNISMLQLLREEIVTKTKEKALYKMKIKQFKLV